MEETGNLHAIKKRKLNTVTELHEAKKQKLDINLLDLPDYVLLEIFSFLQALELIQLSKTCLRFEDLIEEKRLWNVVNLEGDVTEKDVEFIVNRLQQQKTRKISFKPNAELSFHVDWLLNIRRLDNITVIILEKQVFSKGLDDKIHCVLLNFPPSLEVLSLKQSVMSLEDGKYFFSHGDDKLTKLHTLILDFCCWVQESALMVISKLPELKNLSMLGCRFVKDVLSYTGLAGRYGFKKLQRLNVSYTGLADEFIKSFYCLTTLQELYMRIEANRSHFPMTDDSIRWYQHSVPIDPVLPLTETEYFVDPYGPCKCSNGTLNTKDSANGSDDDSNSSSNQDIEDEKKVHDLTVRNFVKCPDVPRNLRICPGPSARSEAIVGDPIIFNGDESEDELPDHHCRVIVEFGPELNRPQQPIEARGIRIDPELNNHMFIIDHVLNPTKKKISLKVLTLRNFLKITDDSLQSLSHLPLRLLDVTGTSVTDEGVKHFINLHPNCRVLHKSACRCPPKPL